MGCGSSVPATSQSERERLKRIEMCHESFKKNDGRLIVKGVLQRANARNRNGRVYPKGILKRETDRYYEYVLKHGRALGELDHPNPHSPTFRCLNFNNVSHQVLEFHWENDDLMGTVEVLPTPAGSMLKDLYLAGCRLGMSSRGWATLKEKDGCVYIQDDFELITFDFVSDPSTDGAYLEPVVQKLGLPVQIDLVKMIKHLKASSGHVDLHAPHQATAGKKQAPAVAAAPPDTSTVVVPMDGSGSGDRAGLRPSTPGPVTSRDKVHSVQSHPVDVAGGGGGRAAGAAALDRAFGAGEPGSSISNSEIAAQPEILSHPLKESPPGSRRTSGSGIPNHHSKNQVVDSSAAAANGANGHGAGRGGEAQREAAEHRRGRGPRPPRRNEVAVAQRTPARRSEQGGAGGGRGRDEAMTLREYWHRFVGPQKQRDARLKGQASAGRRRR